MPEKSRELANLARIGKLAVESGTRGELVRAIEAPPASGARIVEVPEIRRTRLL